MLIKLKLFINIEKCIEICYSYTQKCVIYSVCIVCVFYNLHCIWIFFIKLSDVAEEKWPFAKASSVRYSTCYKILGNNTETSVRYCYKIYSLFSG